MDANKIDELNATQRELQHRRSLALARHERESERKSLLDKLMEAERRAGHLRTWIASQELRLEGEAHGELNRMLQWAGDELAALETMAEPSRLITLLRNQNLFPAADELADSLGDPPPLRPWGR